MTDVLTNARGEYTGADGKVWHLNPNSQAPYDHEGLWLSCDECNPVVQVGVTQELAQLQAEWAAAKAAKKQADEREKAATAKLKTAMFAASNNAPRSLLVIEGVEPVGLTLSEPWTLDTKRLQAEQPQVYVQYAKQGERWTLAARKGQ